MSYETIECPTHRTQIPVVSKEYAEANALIYGCGFCRDELATAPDPMTMTREERVEELRRILGPNYAGFDVIWPRVDALVGRGTMTHELAYPEYLEHEIMTGLVPSVEGIIAKLPRDKPVTVVRLGF